MLADQLQAQIDAGLRAAGGKALLVLAMQVLHLQAHLGIALPKLIGQGPMGGGRAAVELPGFGQEEGTAAQAAQGLVGRAWCQPVEQRLVIGQRAGDITAGNSSRSALSASVRSPSTSMRA